MTDQDSAVRREDVPLSAISAAFIAALIGFGGTVALIVQAGQTVGASNLQIISAVSALCLGIGLAGGSLSFWFRMPIVFAWSTPGAALIAANVLPISYPVAVGSFVAAALLMLLLGSVPALGRLVKRIPTSLAAAMLAGVLLPFCLGLFRAFQIDVVFTGVLLLAFIVARLRFPTYALLIVLVVAVGIIIARGKIQIETGRLFGALVPTTPAFQWQSIISLGVPLFLVTLVSQNLPGLAVLRSVGYQPPAQSLLLASGAATLFMAPFGAHGINLAAITAAICTGDDAHPDPSRRYVVGLFYAGVYMLLALFSAPLVSLFLAAPRETIGAITGVALIGPLTNAIGGMLNEPEDRDAAVLTFIATASGMNILGIGSAFWGLVVGFLALGVKRVIKPRAAAR